MILCAFDVATSSIQFVDAGYGSEVRMLLGMVISALLAAIIVPTVGPTSSILGQYLTAWS